VFVGRVCPSFAALHTLPSHFLNIFTCVAAMSDPGEPVRRRSSSSGRMNTNAKQTLAASVTGCSADTTKDSETRTTVDMHSQRVHEKDAQTDIDHEIIDTDGIGGRISVASDDDDRDSDSAKGEAR
jgi:hypothetical protein